MKIVFQNYFLTFVHLYILGQVPEEFWGEGGTQWCTALASPKITIKNNTFEDITAVVLNCWKTPRFKTQFNVYTWLKHIKTAIHYSKR